MTTINTSTFSQIVFIDRFQGYFEYFLHFASPDPFFAPLTKILWNKFRFIGTHDPKVLNTIDIFRLLIVKRNEYLNEYSRLLQKIRIAIETWKGQLFYKKIF